jgi:hypothetical protein
MISLVCAVLATSVQQKIIQPRVSSPTAVSDMRPVTGLEANEVFAKTRQILSQALNAHLPATTITRSDRPVSKEQVVEEFSSILHSLTPVIRFTPTPMAFSHSVLKISPSALPKLESLIRFGYVGKVGPLATNPQDRLTPRQFGEAVGMFLSRTAEVTHDSTSKWSPILGAGR